MRSILATIRFALAEAETVYLHCWGGVGRTGTVVGCLAREAGVPAEEVLGRLAGMRSQTARAHRTSPETSDQRTFVEAWQGGERTLVLDQQAIDRLAVAPLPSEPAPVPTQEEIIADLAGGNPVVIEGPGPGWCVQGLADAAHRAVRIEVLDPEYWQNGPALPAEHQRVIEALGLARDVGMWSATISGQGASGLRSAATLMLTIAERLWGLAEKG